jgi:predicted Zn finger-like uncharacterized protein
MLITCSKCKIQGEINNVNIYDNGRIVNCKKCNHTFVVTTDYIDVRKIRHEICQKLLSNINYSKYTLDDEVNRVIIEKCNILEKSRHNCLEIFYKRAKAFLDLGNHDLALRDLEKAITIQPRFANLYNMLGELYFRIGDYGKAIENFNLSSGFDLYDIAPMINRARVHIKQGNYELAKDDIERILRIDPQSQTALMLRFTVNLFIYNNEANRNDASVVVTNLDDLVSKIDE